MDSSVHATATQRPYHHGNLKAALVEAGLVLARAGGPDALSLREVTRAVGVTPNAAYRHFADLGALLFAVAARAQEQVADAMAVRMGAADDEPDPARRAIARLRGVGLGYIDFARREPGLFQLAFRSHEQFARSDTADQPPPFRLLVESLDDLVAAGVLRPSRREHAEWPCWAAVHGLADLATRGPLFDRSPTALDALAAVVVERIIEGVIGG